MIAAANYVRISKDSEALGRGVLRQRTDNSATIKQKQWAEHAVYTDNDTAASRKRGQLPSRPAFTTLCTDIEAGHIQAVVGWDVDRLFRDPLEQERFILLAERAHLHRIATASEEIDVESGEGFLILRIKTAVAAEEVRKLSKRLKRKHDEIAEAGRLPSGFRYGRPFGYDVLSTDGHLTGLVVRVDEAVHIVDAAESILAGDGLHTVIRQWNHAGLPRTVSGGQWTRQTLRQILCGGFHAGLRNHHGNQYPAMWPAIIPMDLHDRLVRKLAIQRTGHRRVPSRSFLIGLIHCARCARPMRTSSAANGRAYHCRAEDGGCGQSINAERTEHHVYRDILHPLLTSPVVADAVRKRDRRTIPPSLITQLDRDSGRLSDLEDAYWTLGTVSRVDYERNKAQLSERIKSNRDLAGTYTIDPCPIPDLLAHVTMVESLWSMWSVEKKASIARYFIETVTVGPAVRGRVFDAGRVGVELRGLRLHQG